MLKFYFYFLQIHTFEKSDKDQSFGEQKKLTNHLICFLLSSVVVKISYEN